MLLSISPSPTPLCPPATCDPHRPPRCLRHGPLPTEQTDRRRTGQLHAGVTSASAEGSQSGGREGSTRAGLHDRLCPSGHLGWGPTLGLGSGRLASPLSPGCFQCLPDKSCRRGPPPILSTSTTWAPGSTETVGKPYLQAKVLRFCPTKCHE